MEGPMAESEAVATPASNEVGDHLSTVHRPPSTVHCPMPLVPTGACWICGAEAWDRVWSDPFDLWDLARSGPHAHAEHPPSWVVRCRACGFGQPEGLPDRPDYFEVLYERPWPPEALEA